MEIIVQWISVIARSQIFCCFKETSEDRRSK